MKDVILQRNIIVILIIRVSKLHGFLGRVGWA